MLDTVTATEREVIRYKKMNDALIKSQKSLREREAELLCKQERARRMCAEQISELEQQIMDLTFYSSTQLKVQSSPLRDEISEGVVMMPQQQQSTPTASSNSSGGCGKKKKVKKKH